MLIINQRLILATHQLVIAASELPMGTHSLPRTTHCGFDDISEIAVDLHEKADRGEGRSSDRSEGL